MFNISYGAVFHISQKVCYLPLSQSHLTYPISLVSEGTLSKVLHFDSKAVVENYIRSLNIPATFLLMGLFSEFPVQNLFPLPTDASKYVLAFPIPPNTSLPLISAAVDTGKFVSAILSQRSSLLGKEICAAERMYTIVEMVEILKEAGIDVVYQQVTEEQWKESLGKVGFPEHFQDDLTENSRWFVQYGYFGPGTKELVEEGHKVYFLFFFRLKQEVENKLIMAVGRF